MSKTIIAVKHFASDGRESPKSAVKQKCKYHQVVMRIKEYISYVVNKLIVMIMLIKFGYVDQNQHNQTKIWPNWTTTKQ